MTFLVVDRNLQSFQRRIKTMFNHKDSVVIRPRQGQIAINDDTYLYVNDPIKLRGWHGVKVLFWYTPDNEDEWKQLAACAERE